jgi:DNA polymerase-4
VTVKIKYANFRQITRTRSCSEAITSRAIIEQIALDLLQPRGVRLLGVTLSNFDTTIVAENPQIPLALR